MCTVVVSLRDMFGCAAGNVSECVQEGKEGSCCSELERSWTGGLGVNSPCSSTYTINTGKIKTSGP